MLPAFILAMICQISVKTTFKKYSKVKNKYCISGADAARAVLATGCDGVRASNVRVTSISGELTDRFDPRSNEIMLSDGVFSAKTVAAVGVAAHEAGHALQYEQGYTMMKIRSAIIPICNIGASLTPYLILIGLVFSNMYLYLLGIFGYCTVAFFQLVTLPVEFNASRRAVAAIKSSGILTDEELIGVKKVLTAAAMTYVAALFSSLMQILYYISLVSDRRDKR